MVENREDPCAKQGVVWPAHNQDDGAGGGWGWAAGGVRGLKEHSSLDRWLLGPERWLWVQIPPLALERDGAEDHAGHPADPVAVTERREYPAHPSEPSSCHKP